MSWGAAPTLILTMVGCSASAREPAGAGGGSPAASAATGGPSSSAAGTGGSAGGGGAPTCPDGYADCDGDASNGCEASLADDGTHCGACDVVCATGAHATASSCAGSQCVSTCEAGWMDCDGFATTGCEASTDSDANNCGGCGKTCGAHASCDAGKCACTTAPFANCDLTFTDGCETNTGADALNCGACDNDCGTAGCNAGQCTAPPGLTTLASGLGILLAVAVDSAHVYFGGSAVGYVPVGGGAPVTLASAGTVTSIAVDAGYLYFTDGDDGTVGRVPVGGGPKTLLASGFALPRAIAVSGGNVYFSDEADLDADGSVNVVAADGSGAVTAIAAGITGPEQLAIIGGSLYWTVAGPPGGVESWPLGGGAVVQLGWGALGSPTGIAVDATHVYFTEGLVGDVQRVALAGGPATTIGAGFTKADAIVTDGLHVYIGDWAGQAKSGQLGHRIVRALVDGSSPENLVSAQSPRAMALDATSLYWVNGSGEIMKADK